MNNETFEMVAKTLYGLEEILAGELLAIGANDIEIGRRMVSFTGDKEVLYRANFCCRTALRILKPIYHFKAKDADTVYKEVKKVVWENYMSLDKTFAIDSVIYSEDFNHSKFVAYRTKDAIVDYFMEKHNKTSFRTCEQSRLIHQYTYLAQRLYLVYRQFGREPSQTRIPRGTDRSTAERSAGCRYDPEDRLERRIQFRRPDVRFRYAAGWMGISRFRGRIGCSRQGGAIMAFFY